MCGLKSLMAAALAGLGTAAIMLLMLSLTSSSRLYLTKCYKKSLKEGCYRVHSDAAAVVADTHESRVLVVGKTAREGRGGRGGRGGGGWRDVVVKLSQIASAYFAHGREGALGEGGGWGGGGGTDTKSRIGALVTLHLPSTLRRSKERSKKVNVRSAQEATSLSPSRTWVV
jgi:hypothetical protein